MRVNVVCFGTLNASSAVTSMWSEITGDTVAFVFGMFVSARCEICCLFVGCVFFVLVKPRHKPLFMRLLCASLFGMSQPSLVVDIQIA